MPEPLVTVRLEGHLTRVNLAIALTQADAAMSEARDATVQLLVDCRDMTGYDADARELFVAWHKRSRAHVKRTAIVIEQPLWRVVIGAMSLASGAAMKGFESVEPARSWLTER
jgi:hypothetical protein